MEIQWKYKIDDAAKSAKFSCQSRRAGKDEKANFPPLIFVSFVFKFNIPARNKSEEEERVDSEREKRKACSCLLSSER